MKESDLYLPLKLYLEEQGYEVKGEVKDCDVMAVREQEEPVIVEFKLSINLSVVLQAVDRLSLSSKVYIGLPKQYKLLRNRKRKIIKLLKMLGLGLIIIDPSIKRGCVDVVVDPKEYKPRQSKAKLQRHLGEFHKRVGDPNLGGSSTMKGRVTAYRQRSLAIGHYLKDNGATKASVVAEQIQEPKARDILYKNYYGWFVKESRGVYKITSLGIGEIIKWQS
ncbi:MAG: hypothetical protein JKX98_09735 [Alcanivoracaceae bacterium]|nr:hypothetical protein [Alcanivoracaceae bacterium]